MLPLCVLLGLLVSFLAGDEVEAAAASVAAGAKLAGRPGPEAGDPRCHHGSAKLAGACPAPPPRRPCPAREPVCLSPAIHFQNYQDVNVAVEEAYDFVNTLPLLGPGPAEWTVSSDGGASYVNGVFSAVNEYVVLTKNAPVALSPGGATYVSTLMDFTAVGLGIDSPLGLNTDPYYGFGFLSVYDMTVADIYYAIVLTNAKVYVLYSRSGSLRSINNDYLAFTYLIPVSDYLPFTTYTIVLNSDQGITSFLMNGVVKLAILQPGFLIDQKFLINPVTGDYPRPAYAQSLVVQLGISRLTIGDPHTACQEATFDYCNRQQSLQNAVDVVCTYEPIQLTPYTVDMTLILSGLSVTRATAMSPACSGRCAAQP